MPSRTFRSRYPHCLFDQRSRRLMLEAVSGSGGLENTVASTLTSRRSAPGTVIGSASSTTKSARLPARMEPISFSRPMTRAAPEVTASSADARDSCSVARPLAPLMVSRSLAAHTNVRGDRGAIGASEWSVRGTPLRSREPSRVICAARSASPVAGVGLRQNVVVGFPTPVRRVCSCALCCSVL